MFSRQLIPFVRYWLGDSLFLAQTENKARKVYDKPDLMYLDLIFII